MNFKDIIHSLYGDWLTAKKEMERRCEAAGMQDVATKLAECSLFKGVETIPELAKLFTSPQGLEFCLAANFPTLATLQLFKECGEQYGIYIDAGEITLHNPTVAILIGNTSATIYCNECQSSTIATMHSATATVLASGWAVVRIQAGAGTNIAHRKSENAIVI